MNTKLVWKIFATTITSVILVAITASPLAAEKPIDNSEYIYCCHGNQSGWGRRQYSRRYNLNNVETLKAKVISVDTFTSRRETSQGIHLLVNTGKETLEVHLGPSWYLENQDFDIIAEDEITIIGSRINLNGEEEIVASQLEKGNKTFILRDENGFPMWRGWSR